MRICLAEFRHADPIQFGELVAGLGPNDDAREGAGYRYNWSTAGAAVLTSPWQGETSACARIKACLGAMRENLGTPHGQIVVQDSQPMTEWYQSRLHRLVLLSIEVLMTLL